MKMIHPATLAFAIAAFVSTYAAANPDGQITEVTDQAQIQVIIEALQKHLSAIAPTSHINKCIRVVDYIVHGIRDTSFGALCMVDIDKRKFILAMCDDRLIGKFGLSEAVDENNLGVFVENVCEPGG